MANKPRIRFRGFTEDWEQRKFSDITYLSGIKNKENKPYESYSISNEFGFIPQDEQFENGGTMKTADKSMYYIVSQNSFAYNPARINVGSIGYYDKPNNVIVSSLYEVFKTIDIVNDKFLWHWFKSNQFNRLIEKYQEGGVRLYFYYDKLCKGTIDLPTINEQNKISNLLDRLDLYITLHQCKLKKLNLAKKSLLQKLFPRNGSQIPGVRFKGFTDAWEQRKLGEVVKSYSGGTPTASNKEYYGGDIPFIRSAEINSDTTELYITQKGVDNSSAKIVEKGTILYAMYGATSGEVGISKINGAINQAILAMIPLDYNGKIIAQYLRKNKESIIGKYLQGGQGNLSANIILELPIQLPGLEESNQIANFLESFDKIITLHQRKLERLQEVKKGLLQKMFV